VLVSHHNDPVLSVWRVGLGKAVAFTPDVEGVWSRDWVGWEGWGRLWSQLFRWSVSGTATTGVHVRSGWRAGRVQIAADVVGEAGEYVNFARLQAAVTGPRGTRQELTLRQTGPGRYQGSAPVEAPGAWLVSVTHTAADDIVGAGTAMVDVPTSPEFRPTGDGRANLERVAALTGAKLGADPDRVFLHDLPIPGVRRPLRPLLLWLLPVLMLVDVGVRRVALPEGWWSRSFGRLAAPLRRRRARAARERAALARLRTAKESTAHRTAPAGAGDRTGVAPSTTEPTAAPASPAAPPPAPAVEPEPAPARSETPAPASTTSRLLEAKRRKRS
jgi:hypothetical protein